MAFSVGRHTMLIVNILFKTSIFQKIIGLRCRPRNLNPWLTSFPASSVNPRVGMSLPASETDDRFYLSLLHYI